MTGSQGVAAEACRRVVAGIVPCYNAGNRVRPVMEQLVGLLEVVILVDDGSTDGAPQELAELPLQLIKFPKNRGKGHAILAGIREALRHDGIEAVCLLDADGQHNPGEIAGFFEAFRREKADLVIGMRQFDPALVPWRSRFGNKVTVTCTAWLLGRRLPDTQCGFRLLSRRFAERVAESVAGGRYETEMEVVVKAVREGFKVVYAPITTIYEEGNRSSHFHKFRDSVLIYSRLLRSTLGRRKPGE